MHQRRTQDDLKSSSSVGGSLSTITTTNNSQSPGRTSIYSMRERVTLNKMTHMMGKQAPGTETEMTSRLHQEIPAIRLDGHLTYCLYITLQNLIHLNAIYILLYHAVFWLTPSKPEDETSRFIKRLEKSEYEQTDFVAVSNNNYSSTRSTINVYVINEYIYISLVGISSIELITAFIWTLRKKLPYFIQRYPKWRNQLGLLLIGMIMIIYLSFITWLVFHTFITHHLSRTFFFLILIHFILLTFLDKPNLFQQSFSTSNINRKPNRLSTSSMVINSTSRLFYRPSTLSLPLRKINSITNSSFPSWYRWSSVMEQKLDTHECSTVYTETRQEADHLWTVVVQRMALTVYRTIASVVFFDVIPLATTDSAVRPVEHLPYIILVIVFGLTAFTTHSTFLFPIKLQTTLHRLATHLGQWRLHSITRPNTINEWSSECNSYARGSIVKLSSSKTEQHFIAIQHLGNAAHPQSISHSILYQLFGDARFFLGIQYGLSKTTILFQLFWVVRAKYWHESLIVCLTVLNSSYTIFKITRDRLLLEMVDNHESDEIILTSKQKKSN